MSAIPAGAHPAPQPATSGSRRGLAGFVRRHPLGAFFAWFFTVGQAIAFIPVLADTPLPRHAYIVASTLLGLLLPTLVITRIVDGPAGVRALWHRAVHVRAAASWYALALLAIPLLAVLIAATFLGTPARLSPSALTTAVAANLLLPLVVTFVFTNWWEEVAWTGFVQARLQHRHGPLTAALLTAPLFGLQHISLAAGNSLAAAVAIMLLFTALTIPFRIVNGWLYNRTGSLFLVGLMHAAGNAVATGSGFQTGFLAHLYPGNALALTAHQLAFAVLGLLVAIGTRGRLGARPANHGRLLDSPGREETGDGRDLSRTRR
jgi:membrane protease YdiL (CAAX protease family)